jgi:geranylgeranyl diphosphate synthase type II
MSSVLYDLKGYTTAAKARVDAALSTRLTTLASTPKRLAEAMSYSVLGDGKRVRPILAMASYEAVGQSGDAILPVAGSLELIHAYSLVHDDLPAMDDDDYRRGRLTCHKAYDDATAVLVGDGLQALAFSWLGESEFDAETRIRLVTELASAAGPWGMVGGQMADMNADDGPRDLDHLRFIHAHKTGALLTASARMGGIAAGADDEQLAALTTYGGHVGLAFQVVDDILDVTADSATLGKTAGKDSEQNKLTYPSLMGLDEAKALAADLATKAIAALAPFGHRAEPLSALANYIVERGR